MRNLLFFTPVFSLLLVLQCSNKWCIYGKEPQALQNRTERFLSDSKVVSGCDPSYFNRLMALRETSKRCTMLDEAFGLLHHLTSSTPSNINCLNNTTKILADTVYDTSYGHCAGKSLSYYLSETSYHYSTHHGHYDSATKGLKCLHDHRYYKELYNVYYNTGTQRCILLSEAARLLSGMDDEECARDFIEHLYNSLNQLSSSSLCHCTFEDDRICDSVPEYTNLFQLVKNNNCLSVYAVMKPLQKLLMQDKTLCFRSFISKFAKMYEQYTSTPSFCQCTETGNLDSVGFVSLSDGNYQSCKRYSLYSDVINGLVKHSDSSQHVHSLGSTRTCQTHHSLWVALGKLQHKSITCTEDAVAHVAASVDQYGDPCSCVQTGAPPTTTTTVKTPSPITTAWPKTTALPKTPALPKTTQLPQTSLQFTGITCDKLKTIQSLATHNPVDGTSSHQCPDGTHVKSEAVPIVLCGAPEKSAWQKGVNVLQNCDSLPKYIAVASFIGDIYPAGDGKAGVMISCNSTELTIVTQECDGGMKFEHIIKGPHEHFKDIPEAYYTITSSSTITSTQNTQTVVLIG